MPSIVTTVVVDPSFAIVSIGLSFRSCCKECHNILRF
jgi:hypothetical protein